MSGRNSMDSIVVRLAGDSGDGVQLMGSQFIASTALSGMDFATFPDYPAEIRACRYDLRCLRLPDEPGCGTDHDGRRQA
jgi:hypothetical protein